MNTSDIIRMAINNLWRTKIRAFLTILGVIVGIGALSSMISFGLGMQKNFTDAFTANDLFTSMRVSSKNMDIDNLMSGQIPVNTKDSVAAVLLDSALLLKIQAIAAVEIAFAQNSFSLEVAMGGNRTKTSALALPAHMGHFAPFNDMRTGHFFASDQSDSVVLKENLLDKLKIRLIDPGVPQNNLSAQDSTDGYQLMHPDSLIGKEIQLITTVIDYQKMFLGGGMNAREMPTTEIKRTVIIAGISKANRMFSGGMLNERLFLSPRLSAKLPKMDLNNITKLLDRQKNKNQFASIYVRVNDMDKLAAVRAEIENMGVSVFAMGDRLEEIKKPFIIMNSILAAVGTIALFVASLGIINTMIMSVMERTKDIGIMMAIGASGGQIMKIFFIEAATIGFVGGILGLILGWLVTRVANWVILMQENAPQDINIFYFSPWLIAGSILFAMGISLLAGLYPARRAAGINPLESLRHD